MKKLLGIIVLGLLLSGNAYALSKCTVKKPNIDKLFDWQFTGKDIYPDTRLGESLHFKLQHRNRTLSYYSYNLGFNSIDHFILVNQLSAAVADMKYRFSQDKNVILKDKVHTLPINKFHNSANMKNFISEGKFMEFLFKTSSGSKPYLTMLALGTDGDCIYKIRYTIQLAYMTGDQDRFGYTIALFEQDLEFLYKIIN